MDGRALFLCYPPPASDMAVECLRFFRGKTVAVVGEWDGDTATAEFTTALTRAFRLKRRVPLPKYARACLHPPPPSCCSPLLSPDCVLFSSSGSTQGAALTDSAFGVEE